MIIILKHVQGPDQKKMPFYDNNWKNLLHKILVNNATRKNKLTAQSPMTPFEGKGRNIKRLSGKTYLQFFDRRPSVKLEPLLKSNGDKSNCAYLS